MASAVKYEHFAEALGNAEVDVFGTTNTWQAAIANSTDTPVVATDDELADVTQITGTGYSAGGKDVDNNGTRSGGTVTMVFTGDGSNLSTWTASAADWDTGRWVVVYDGTSTTDILGWYYDYGSGFTVGNGETFTVDWGSSSMTLA